MVRIKLKKLLTDAFILGFMISREGYNAECLITSLAPSKLDIDWTPYEDFAEYETDIKSKPEFNKLLIEMLEKLSEE